MTIVTLTLNPTIDKTCTVEQVVPGKKLRCEQPEFHPGGGGLNVARAIAKLGGDVEAYWTCGGAIGELLKQLLDDEGVAHHPIAIEAMTRENLIVHDEANERQFRFGMPGAKLTAGEVRDCMDQLCSLSPTPEYLVLSGSLPPGTESDLYARIAKAMPNDCRVILDTSGPALKQGIEGSIYLIKPNIRELGQLANHRIEDDEQIAKVAKSLVRSGRVKVVVTSLGSGGVVLTTADMHENVRAPTVTIRSKVGAGDSTVAGLALGLARGLSLSGAVRFGVAAGSAAVMTTGTELCRREDTERIYESIV